MGVNRITCKALSPGFGAVRNSTLVTFLPFLKACIHSLIHSFVRFVIHSLHSSSLSAKCEEAGKMGCHHRIYLHLGRQTTDMLTHGAISSGDGCCDENKTKCWERD